MVQAATAGKHIPPNIWLKLGAFNLTMAIALGAFLGIAARALVIVYMDWEAGRGFATLRAVKGAAFLLLGALYALFAWPMLKWDHPARFLTVITISLPPIVAAYRRSKGQAPAAPKLATRLLAVFLTLVLLVAATLTLLRTGFITLAADRVPLIVETTGETRVGETSAPWIPAAQRAWTDHRVIMWLPDGTRAADLWVPGDRVAFGGMAVVFSRRLNAMGFPNLYRFLSVHARPGESPSREVALPMPHTGALEVNALWRPIQAVILRAWPRASEGAWAFWAARIVENKSPFYPLVGKDGRPLKARFLLDLTLEGVPTSRGSSPLEAR
jgi:hypothetical protein